MKIVMKAASNFNEKISGFLRIKLLPLFLLFPAETFVENFIHNLVQDCL